jgi:hypothetical protein
LKWLLALVMLCGTASAEKIVIMEPIIAAACPNADTWPLVLDCFKKHGLTATIVATLDDAKLVAVTSNDTTNDLEGFGLYVHADSKKAHDAWRLGGLLEETGNLADFTVVHIDHLPKHGYRFDMAASQPSSTSIDGVTAVASIYRQVMASICSGENYRCMQLVPKCEQIVRGQTVMAFDGTITIHENIASLKGVGSVPACSASADYAF